MNELSDEEKKRLAEALNKKEDPSALDNIKRQALIKLAQGLNKVDSYSGAPLRAGLAAASEEQLKPENGFFSASPTIEGAKAMYNQFGQDPENAPSNQEVWEKAGLSSTPMSNYLPGLYNDPSNYKNNTVLDELKPEKGGSLDISPASAMGGIVGMETDPVMHVPVPGFGKLKKLIKPNP